MIPQETVNLILDTARIEDVVGEFVTLKRRGSSLWACCPFHNEKTPSFHVEPSRGIYKCFGCGKSGTAVGFLMEYEKLSYTEALKFLARKYHIEVVEKEESAEDIAARQRNESLLSVSEYAFRFYKEQLATDEGRTIGLAYFRSRGLLDETIEKYGLGWAPRSRHAFTDAATAEGYKGEYLTETGLCAAWDDGSLHDRFYDRVMFPIHSVSGRIIAFGGRTLLNDKTVAKYVNSKESEIYVKSRSLYGIYFAKNEIARQDKCFLVEGYLDVLSMHQLGITNVVASSGTSLTEEQIRLIRKFTENVTIMYDGDAAGIHAALRGIGMILREGMNVKVVLIPDGDDPDSYARKHSREEVERFIASHEQDFISFKTDLLLSEAGDDPIKRANLINDIADTIADIPDAVKRSVYADACARKFHIESDILLDRIRMTRQKIQAEQHSQAQREEARRRHASGESAETAPVPSSEQPTVRRLLEQNRLLAPSERELLGFILTDGCTPLSFETDSEFYDPAGTQTVAEFIDDALAADGIDFANEAYRLTYEAFFSLYTTGKSQDEIVRTLLDGPDRTVAAVTADLAEEKYHLSVENFSAALTVRSTWLVTFVPRAILAYNDKRLDNTRNRLTAELKDASPDRQVEIMAELGQINAMKKKINIKLGRLKTD